MESDQQNFLREISKHSGILHKICNIYFGDDPDARQDVYQEIIYQLWKSYSRFNGHAAFSTWMYKVALNTAITHIKRSHRVPPKERLTGKYNQLAEPEPENEQITLLYNEINKLTAMDKAIILLHLERNSYKRISAITGLSKGNVSVRLVRIKKTLKEKFNHKTNYDEVM